MTGREFIATYLRLDADYEGYTEREMQEVITNYAGCAVEGCANTKCRLMKRLMAQQNEGRKG